MSARDAVSRLNRTFDSFHRVWWTRRRLRWTLLCIFLVLALAGGAWWWFTGSSVAWWLGPLLALPLSLAATTRPPGAEPDDELGFGPMEGPYSPP